MSKKYLLQKLNYFCRDRKLLFVCRIINSQKNLQKKSNEQKVVMFNYSKCNIVFFKKHYNT